MGIFYKLVNGNVLLYINLYPTVLSTLSDRPSNRYNA